LIAVRLIVGLGNPGKAYEATRHNVGFRVIDRLVRTLEGKPLDLTRWYNLFDGMIGEERLLLLYPLTYMNRSGSAVNDVAREFDINTRDIIIVYDDFNLPLGRIRIRAGGSAGGHNGLGSIIETMQTKEIPRVRLGIFNENSFVSYIDPADFVLSNFETEEEPKVESMIERAHKATLTIVKEGIPKAMNSFNTVADEEKSNNLSNNMES
jgi:peptidyl-tRNA hydrolase, PTH1 family